MNTQWVKVVFGILMLALGLLFTSPSLAQEATEGANHVEVTVEELIVPEGTITIEKVEGINIGFYYEQQSGKQVNSVLIFMDDLNAFCGSSGAQFQYSTTTGTSHYTLAWSGGQFANDKYCSSTCSFTITTSWSAYYTTAGASVQTPMNIWGPNDAYKCR